MSREGRNESIFGSFSSSSSSLNPFASSEDGKKSLYVNVTGRQGRGKEEKKRKEKKRKEKKREEKKKKKTYEKKNRFRKSFGPRRAIKRQRN